MEIRVLEYFLTVARTGSFNTAAQLLHLSQPTLSRQIKDLEETLGKQLLVRNNKGIKLTEEGRILRKRAQEILDLVQKTETEISTNEEEISGDIHIGAGETEAVHYIGDAAKTIHTQYPNTTFHITSGDTQDLLEQLDKGLVDFALVFDEIDETKYHHLNLPEKDRWGILTRKDDKLADKTEIKNTDLTDVPLILSRQIKGHSRLMDWMGKPLNELNVVATYSLLYNAAILTSCGLGCTVCLDKIINTTGDSNLTFVPFQPGLTAGMKIIWKRYQVFSRLSTLFLETLKEEVKNRP